MRISIKNKSQKICRNLLFKYVTGSNQYYYDDVELAIKANYVLTFKFKVNSYFPTTKN